MRITFNLQSFNGIKINEVKRLNKTKNLNVSIPLKAINKDVVSFGGIKKIQIE